jgi:hypothetical protein
MSSISVSGGNSVIIKSKERVVIRNGITIPFDKRMKGSSVSVINGKCYVDGYELIGDKWKKTIKAIWHKYKW